MSGSGGWRISSLPPSYCIPEARGRIIPLIESCYGALFIASIARKARRYAGEASQCCKDHLRTEYVDHGISVMQNKIARRESNEVDHGLKDYINHPKRSKSDHSVQARKAFG